MKYKSIIALNIVALAGIAAYAKHKTDNIGIVQATDMYAKNPNTSVCCRIVNNTNCLSSAIQKGTIGQQATMKSDGGTRYTLWEDANCTTTPLRFSC